MKYLCLICAETVMEQMPEAEAEKHFEEYSQFTEDIRKSGHFIGVNRLEPPHAATTVRVRKGKVSTTDQAPHDPLLEKEGNRENGPIRGPRQDGPNVGGGRLALFQNVGNPDGRPLGRRLSNSPLTKPDECRPERLEMLRIYRMSGSHMEFLRGGVVLVNDTAARPRKLYRPGHDGTEHRLQVEGRADRLANLPQRLQLLH